jgi:hypothetical protein
MYDIMTDSLLDEYVKITKKIDIIQNKINRYKKKIELNIEKSKSEKEQNDKLQEFKEIVETIKNDPTIVGKYKLLKQRQKELRDLIISSADNESDLLIANMKSKYNKPIE